jgi:hypothetical protein
MEQHAAICTTQINSPGKGTNTVCDTDCFLLQSRCVQLPSSRWPPRPPCRLPRWRRLPSHRLLHHVRLIFQSARAHLLQAVGLRRQGPLQCTPSSMQMENWRIACTYLNRRMELSRSLKTVNSSRIPRMESGELSVAQVLIVTLGESGRH